MGITVPAPPRQLQGISYNGQFVTPDDVGMERFLEMLKDSSTVIAPGDFTGATVRGICRYCGTRIPVHGANCPNCGAVA